MYRPPHFDVTDIDALHRHMREQSFALMITTADGAPVASHVPLLLDTDAGGPGRLLGHVAKANPQWLAFDGETDALALFWGPHAYVSPTWYVSETMVPTWNYVTVHAYGRPRVLSDPADARDVLARLTGSYESAATGPWRMDSLPDEYVEKQLKGIVAFEMPIARLEGKFKLSQNRSDADRQGAIDGLEATGGADAEALARLMKANPPRRK